MRGDDPGEKCSTVSRLDVGLWFGENSDASEKLAGRAREVKTCARDDHFSGAVAPGTDAGSV